MHNVLTIYFKELKEVLRDRRTLIFMLLMPTVIVPVLMNAFIGFAVHMEQKARTETLRYAIFGSEFLPPLERSSKKRRVLKRSPSRL